MKIHGCQDYDEVLDAGVLRSNYVMMTSPCHKHKHRFLSSVFLLSHHLSLHCVFR